MIERLLLEGECYFIDILPKKIESEQYFELEDYLCENYLETFAEKIKNIIIKLIHYYPAHIFMTESSKEPPEGWDNVVGQDIRSKSLSEIADMITHVITQDFSSMNILLSHNGEFTLVSVNGEFSVDIYNPDEEVLNLITMLVQQEGLFIRKEGD